MSSAIHNFVKVSCQYHSDNIIFIIWMCNCVWTNQYNGFRKENRDENVMKSGKYRRSRYFCDYIVTTWIYSSWRDYDIVKTFWKILGFCNECWAKAYTSKVFTAGIQSTSCTERCNAVLKKQVTSSATLCELAKVLDGRTQSEQVQAAYTNWQISTTSYQAPFVTTQLFPQVYQMLKQYVSPFYLLQVEQQMAEAMLYKATKTTVNDAL